jgi:hypothetical protein
MSLGFTVGFALTLALLLVLTVTVAIFLVGEDTAGGRR